MSLIMSKIRLLAVIGAFALAGLWSVQAIYAQVAVPPSVASLADGETTSETPINDPLTDEFLELSIQEQVVRNRRLREPEVTPDQLGSIFFTNWQYSLLQEAKAGFMSRPVTQADLTEEPSDASKDPGRRELALGGIVYTNAKDWTIWLNGQRVTPDAMPEHVMDLSVANQYVDLKWFDPYTNLIFPIRLRPHERFNLDTRMFLPGEGT